MNSKLTCSKIVRTTAHQSLTFFIVSDHQTRQQPPYSSQKDRHLSSFLALSRSKLPNDEATQSLSEDKETLLCRLLAMLITSYEKAERLQEDHAVLQQKIDHLLSGNSDHRSKTSTDEEAETMVKILEVRLQEKDEKLSRMSQLASDYKQACDDILALHTALDEKSVQHTDALRLLEKMHKRIERLEVEKTELKRTIQDMVCNVIVL